MILPRWLHRMLFMVAATEPEGLDGIQPAAATARTRFEDDMPMLRAAAELTRDLVAPNPMIYWPDFFASALIGYGAMAGAIMVQPVWLAVLLGLVSILGMYRAGLFIHELTHIRHAALPWFRFVWNGVIGIPLLAPSFLYEGLHSLHHARTRYGTVEDPEYLPLALMKPWTIPAFVVVSVVAPFALLLRFGILGPLSFVIPPLRRFLVARYSGLVINPEFRRRAPEGDFRRIWLSQEIAATLWAMLVLAGLWFGIIPLRPFLIICAIAAGLIMLNQIRTLVAHRWENDGAVISTTAQFLDSVNVPPPGVIPALWAPVGLRYHAIHHLLPGLPYHALGEAHRRLTAALPSDSAYHQANDHGLPKLVWALMMGAGKDKAAIPNK